MTKLKAIAQHLLNTPLWINIYICAIYIIFFFILFCSQFAIFYHDWWTKMHHTACRTTASWRYPIWCDVSVQRRRRERQKEQEAQLMLINPCDAFRGQSRSPNIVPFHTLGILSSCAIVTLSRFFWYSTSQNVMTLKSGSEVTEGHWKWYHRLRIVSD